jgi:transposase
MVLCPKKLIYKSLFRASDKLFIPPYSLELNPDEKIWQKMKRAFSGKTHQTLDNVSEVGCSSAEPKSSSDLRLNYTIIFYQFHQLFFAPLPNKIKFLSVDYVACKTTEN